MKFLNFLNNTPKTLSAAAEENGTATQNNGYGEQISNSQNSQTRHDDVPEQMFVEFEKPEHNTSQQHDVRQQVTDIQLLYKYLEQNLEKRGYEDSLTNPDSSYMEEQIQFIGNELNLIISKVKTYYTAYMRNIDFHLETRKRSGLIETVDELLAHKDNVQMEIDTVNAIEADALKGIGISQNLFLGYRRGFRNGFAAITYNTILGRRA